MKKSIALFMLLFVLYKVSAQCNFTDSSQVQIGSITKVNADCSTNGSIVVNGVNGGGGTYAYEIISGPVVRIIQSQNSFAALPGGNYVVRVNGCNGTFIDSSISILDTYSPMRTSRWRSFGTAKVSGFTCGVTNNGVYKAFKPIGNFNPGGKAPYKYQINTTNNFASIPFTPTVSDTAYFSNLNASTAYTVRVTDACNNAIVYTFTTAAATTAVLNAEPYLEITPSYDYACFNKGSLGIKIKNLATGADYLGADLDGNFAYWGSGNTPVLRLQVKNSSTNEVYLDNNLKVTSSYSNYLVETDYQFDGPTGLTALNRISYSSWYISYGYVLAAAKTEAVMPINTPLTVTIFFPGGNQCGNVIPAFNKTYSTTIVGNNNPKPVITSVGSNCYGTSPYLTVTASRGFTGNFYVKSLSPYSMIGFLLGTTGDNIFRPEMGNIIGGTAFSLNANNLEVGKTYRVILEDICGRKDSVDYVYSPSSGIAPAIPINDSTAVKLKCNYSNTDSLASIYIKKMPIGYDLSRAYVNGVVANGLGFTGVLLADGDFGYVLNTKLPPGTYSYTLVYRNGCASNSVTKSIVIPPYPALQYRKSFNATVVNIAQSCSGDGKTYIQLNGFVKNVTTRNKVTAVRLISVPNNTVFPLNASNDYSGIPLFSILNSPSYFNGYIIDNNDSSYLFPESYRLFIEPNQIGTYKFAMDIQCEDGSFVETLIATVNVSAAIPYMPRIPSLANANALMCDGGSVLNINTTASGGVGALYYEYKVESSSTWIPTASSGASNSVIINPMPAAGTIYDVRVTDGCGSSSTIKVVAQNFTGNFYIHSFFPDCANPSAIALRTSSVLGAIYTWRKNGMIIGNGTNLYQLNTTIVNGDNITVDVNIFNCYYKNATKVFNPNFENYTWFGIDNNWFNAANWCPGVPTPTSNVKIPAGLATYPIIPTGDALCKNILIENTAFVKVTNNGRLNLYGVITNNGTLDLIDGTLVAKGTQAQVFSGAIFYKRTIKNIEIANSFSTNPVVSLSTTLNDTLNITGNVSYGNVNNKEFKTNDNLTLKSSAARTASLNDITNGGANYGNSIVGKVNVERYMFARSAWRLLATPIQIATSPTVSQAWRENNSAHSATGYGTRITGPVGPFGAVGSLDDYTINPSMKSYNALTNNFTGVTNANTTPIANNKGYYVFVRGDRGAAAVIGLSGITNLRIKGDLRTGDQVFSVPANKFESIGNPFASRIDMRLVNKTNVVNAFYVWNPNNTGLYNVGGYEAYVYNTSTTNYERIGDGLVRNYIESGEAFFVQSNVATAGSLTIKEQDKGNGSANVSRMGVSVPTMDITLYAQNTDSSMYITDGIKINFDATYSNDLDNNDVRKITNSYDNIGLKNGTANLIVERRNNLQATDTLRFNVSGLRVANYRLDIDPSVLDYPGLEAIFIDKFLQTRTVVSFTDVTSIAFTTTADAASKATDRFMIVFKATAIVSFKNIAAVRTEDKVVKINWTVDNEANEGNYTIEHSTDGVNFTAIGTETAINNNGAAASYNKIHSNASTEKNWYRVKANNALGAPKYSAIALVNEVIKTAANTKVTSTIVPRVNRDGQVSVVLNNYEVGKYILLITNATGQVIKQNQVNVNADKFIVDLKTNSVSKGNYQVTLINTNGEKTSCAFIVM